MIAAPPRYGFGPRHSLSEKKTATVTPPAVLPPEGQQKRRRTMLGTARARIVIAIVIGSGACGGNDLQREPLQPGKPDAETTASRDPRLPCAGDHISVAGKCLPRGVGCPVQADYDGNVTVVERYAPELVSDGCIAGGDTGRDVSYHEDAPQELPRSLSIDVAPECAAVSRQRFDFTNVFGLDVTAPASSDETPSLALSGVIPPHSVGQFYRQAHRVERVAVLLNDSGQAVGTATLGDFEFIAEIAVGPTCPVPTRLPPVGDTEVE
jgi:hypothetical protein